MDLALLVGRILLVGIFVLSGVMKFFDIPGTAAYIATKGLPFPELLAVAAAAVETIGGLLVLVGWQTRLAAAALILFTAMAGLLFHDFWNFPAAEQANQMAHFMKNMAVIGGLMVLAVAGPGRYSLDWRGRG